MPCCQKKKNNKIRKDIKIISICPSCKNEIPGKCCPLMSRTIIKVYKDTFTCSEYKKK